MFRVNGVKNSMAAATTKPKILTKEEMIMNAAVAEVSAIGLEEQAVAIGRRISANYPYSQVNLLSKAEKAELARIAIAKRTGIELPDLKSTWDMPKATGWITRKLEWVKRKLEGVERKLRGVEINPDYFRRQELAYKQLERYYRQLVRN
jgi:hypothetical protein